MADATPARSDDASRNEELRAQRIDTPIVALARLTGQADAFYSDADKESSRRKHVAFRAVHDRAYAAMNEGYISLLSLVPQGDDRDLMILAGHAALMADQLNDWIEDKPENAYADRLTKGIAAALTAISATLASQWPAGADSVELIFPELARSIRRDIAITDVRRLDMEAR